MGQKREEIIQEQKKNTSSGMFCYLTHSRREIILNDPDRRGRNLKSSGQFHFRGIIMLTCVSIHVK